MAVFENLRNFIRHGKQAGPSGTSAGTSLNGSVASGHNSLATASAVDLPSSDPEGSVSARSSSAPPSGSTGLEQPSAPVSAQSSNPGTPGARYDNAVKRIIEEENLSRRALPSYAGLERYQLLEKMGDGAFSVVFRAVDKQTGDQRAIKVVSKQQLSTSQRASVLKEAAIMRQLRHQNIVQMHEFLESSEKYFIVLELVPGGELFHQIVRLTYFSEDLSRHVILQVAHAIRYLHEEAGVVHRDIKPENLLFSPIDFTPSKQRVLRPGDDDSKEDEGEFVAGKGAGGIGTIKLADFGLSKIIWDNKTMTPCGTVGYTAPEIVKDERYSKSVDMWALGCVLYTVLCGFPPFYDESIEVLTHKVAKGQYTFLSPWWDGISDSAKDLVSRLLTVDPEKRYTIDEFLQHPWITQDGTVPVAESAEVAAHRAPADATPTERRNRDTGLSGALKDAFDVSNAVYRMEEETALRQPAVPGIIEEEDEDQDIELSHVEHIAKGVDNLGLKNTTHAGAVNGAAANGTSKQPRQRERERAAKTPVGQPGFFDLHLEGATLLERRRRNKEPALIT